MRIGEILIARGKLDAAGVERALRLQKEGGEKLGVLLVTLGLCAQRDVSEALAAQPGVPRVSPGGAARAAARRLRRLSRIPGAGGADLGALPARSARAAAQGRRKRARARDG